MKKFDREQFVADLRDLATQGIPFLHQGSSVETGVDCVNLPRLAYEMQGLRLPEELIRHFDAYHLRPDGALLLRVMRRWFPELLFEETEPADLLMFYARKNPQHLATKVTNDAPPLVVEAYRSDDGHIQRVLEQPLDPRRRIVTCFRIPDFA